MGFDRKTYNYNAITVYSCEQRVFRVSAHFIHPGGLGVAVEVAVTLQWLILPSEIRLNWHYNTGLG